MSKSEINDVSDTALWVAVYRAIETERPDGLFKDPLADKLAGPRGRTIAESMRGTSRHVAWSVVIRTCIIDDFIAKLCAEGIDTVINLGAGLDTRPYRLKLPKTLRWVEVDYPHMIQMKNEKLAQETPICLLERVSVDLADDQARKQFLARMGGECKKALIITEGVTPYLTNDQTAALARDLRAQESFRYWIVDYLSPQVMKYINRDRKRKVQMQNAPFVFNPKDWFGFFSDLGWKPRDIRYLAEESEKLGRAVPMPWWGRLLTSILGVNKKAAYRKFTAYIVLEPKSSL